MTKGATTAATPARKLHIPLIGVIHALKKFARCSSGLRGFFTVSVKFELLVIFALIGLEKLSFWPPNVPSTELGNDIFAIIGIVYSRGSAEFKALIVIIDVASVAGSNETLFGVKLTSMSSVLFV
jgi:hypothetical protein